MSLRLCVTAIVLSTTILGLTTAPAMADPSEPPAAVETTEPVSTPEPETTTDTPLIEPTRAPVIPPVTDLPVDPAPDPTTVEPTPDVPTTTPAPKPTIKPWTPRPTMSTPSGKPSWTPAAPTSPWIPVTPTPSVSGTPAAVVPRTTGTGRHRTTTPQRQQIPVTPAKATTTKAPGWKRGVGGFGQPQGERSWTPVFFALAGFGLLGALAVLIAFIVYRRRTLAERDNVWGDRYYG